MSFVPAPPLPEERGCFELEPVVRRKVKKPKKYAKPFELSGQTEQDSFYAEQSAQPEDESTYLPPASLNEYSYPTSPYQPNVSLADLPLFQEYTQEKITLCGEADAQPDMGFLDGRPSLERFDGGWPTDEFAACLCGGIEPL